MSEESVKLFFKENHEKISKEWEKKLKSIFKEYLPFEQKELGGDEEVWQFEDMSMAWWYGIVEPGWESKTEKLFKEKYEDDSERLFSEKLEEIIDSIIEKLGIPHEVIE